MGRKCVINGLFGGNWEEINMDKNSSCKFSCMTKKGDDNNYKLKEETVKNIPSLNDSDENINTISYNEIKFENKNKKDKDDNCIIF